MNNTYGIVRAAWIDPSRDVEIWVQYRPTHTYDENTTTRFRKLENPSVVLVKAQTEDNSIMPDSCLPGLYTLRLPVSEFGETGFYTVYIKPREVRCTIEKVGNLAAYPNIKGIVINTGSIDDADVDSLFANGSLVGYRVEYFRDDKREDYYRIITSNNRCEVMSGTLSSVNSDLTSYRFNDASDLVFLTLTPSTSPEFMSNVSPYIGTAGQQITIINTKFDPVCLEIEICENDFDTIALSLNGDQVRSLDKGTVTTFNKNGEIADQKEFFTVKDNYTTRDVYEVRIRKTNNIDTSIPRPDEL